MTNSADVLTMCDDLDALWETVELRFRTSVLSKREHEAKLELLLRSVRSTLRGAGQVLADVLDDPATDPRSALRLFGAMLVAGLEVPGWEDVT